MQKKDKTEIKAPPKAVPDYMAEQIRQFMERGEVEVIPPRGHRQNATAFRLSGTCPYRYKKISKRINEI